MDDYFDRKNKEFYEFLEETFELKKCRDWNDVAQKITNLKIKRTYRVFATLFPLNVDYLEEMNNLKGSFSSIHWGLLRQTE